MLGADAVVQQLALRRGRVDELNGHQFRDEGRKVVQRNSTDPVCTVDGQRLNRPSP